MPSLQVGAWVLLLHAEGFCMGLGSKEGHCLMHASCNAAAYGTAGSFWKSGVLCCTALLPLQPATCSDWETLCYKSCTQTAGNGGPWARLCHALQVPMGTVEGHISAHAALPDLHRLELCRWTAQPLRALFCCAA